MQFVSYSHISFSSESSQEDDVDRLFKKLQKHEPPGDIVKQMLARIRQLPVEQRHPRTLEQPDLHALPPSKKQQEASD